MKITKVDIKVAKLIYDKGYNCYPVTAKSIRGCVLGFPLSARKRINRLTIMWEKSGHYSQTYSKSSCVRNAYVFNTIFSDWVKSIYSTTFVDAK